MKNIKLHESLIEGVQHVLKHKSTGKIQNIVDRLKPSLTKERVVQWVLRYTPVQIKEGSTEIFCIKSDFAEFDINSLTKNYYWDVLIEYPESKASIASEIRARLSTFLKDPTQTHHESLIKILSYYQKYTRTPRMKKINQKEYIFVQGGKVS